MVPKTDKQLNLQHPPSIVTVIAILYYRNGDVFIEIFHCQQMSMSGTDGNKSYGSIKISSKSSVTCKWDLKLKGSDFRLGIVPKKICDNCMRNGDGFYGRKDNTEYIWR